ncbi:MAG: efflux RND transporter periplasmic adaptor subunit [Gammaproteobacteria bacterium]
MSADIDDRDTGNRRRQLLFAAAVLVAGVAVAALLLATRSEPQKAPRVERGTLVATWTAETRTERFTVPAQGVVRPARRVAVQPQVGGKVVEINDALVPGGLVSAGDLLFRIEDEDYRLAVESARTRLAEAEAQLALERGRRRVAEREWRLFADERDEEGADPALALREPQLAAAEAAVDAATAQLRQAELNLARTRVSAPFNALVLEENVDPGQTLSPQSLAATLAGTDEAWVQAALPVDRLPYVHLPDDDGSGGSIAEIHYDAGGTSIVRRGRVARLLGDLDPAGRLARVLVTIDDPLALETGGLPLFFDSYVDVEIESDRVLEIVPLERAWLRPGDRVYVYGEDGRLDIRDLEIGWRTPERVMVAGGLRAGELVITSPLASPVEGMKLRLQDEMPVGVREAARNP